MKPAKAVAVVCVSLLWTVAAQGQTRFTDVTDPVLPQFSVPPAHPVFEAVGTNARNVVFVDYDNDGFQDLFVRENERPQTAFRRIGLFRNTGDGRFVDRTFVIPEKYRVGSGGAGAIFADYDNDGDPDLFLPRDHPEDLAEPKQDGSLLLDPEDSILLRNDKGWFVESGVDVGNTVTGEIATDSAIWLDYDRDGNLDLYVGSGSGDFAFDWDKEPWTPGWFTVLESRSDRLLRNNGDGTFSDRTADAGLDDVPAPFPTAEGGMAAADFNDDGWTDLYLGKTAGFQNLLLLNDGEGRFVDATTSEIGDPGVAFNVSVGDINNDQRLDIFQASAGAASGDSSQHDLSWMLLNLGEGRFIDVAPSAGLGIEVLGINADGTVLADIDNDGDLDFVFALTHLSPDARFEPRLLLNDGIGVFSDHTTESGIHDTGPFSAYGDFDEDGSIDLLIASFIRQASPPEARELNVLYRNNGNSNHWLRVELVGVESNRDGIGARLTATTGDKRQIREVLGGLGRRQDEAVVHFGLGQHEQLDGLTVRWPSGQIDSFSDIPAGQKIRIIEGQGRWAPAIPTVWEARPPATAQFGSEVLLSATVRPGLFEPDATITSVTADLSSLGGAASVPLTDLGDGTYQLVSQINVSGRREYRSIDVLVLQQTSLGEHWVSISHHVEITGEPATAVTESFDSTTPASLALSQNYPNPFNPETTIRFDLPQALDIELAVYNAAAQRVATLVQGHRQAGTYTVRWDGVDDAGLQMASGLYFYRLTAGGQVETRKLLLVR